MLKQIIAIGLLLGSSQCFAQSNPSSLESPVNDSINQLNRLFWGVYVMDSQGDLFVFSREQNGDISLKTKTKSITGTMLYVDYLLDVNDDFVALIVKSCQNGLCAEGSHHVQLLITKDSLRSHWGVELMKILEGRIFK